MFCLTYSILHDTILSKSTYSFKNSCHLLSLNRISLIQVVFSAFIKAFKLIIFNPPSEYCLTRISLLIFAFYSIVSHRVYYFKIKSIISRFGFGKAINKRLKMGIIRVFITVISPIGVKLLFSLCLILFFFFFFFICVILGV